MKIIMEGSGKLKMELPYDPDVPHLGIYPKFSESAWSRDTCMLTFITACSQ